MPSNSMRSMNVGLQHSPSKMNSEVQLFPLSLEKIPSAGGSEEYDQNSFEGSKSPPRHAQTVIFEEKDEHGEDVL